MSNTQAIEQLIADNNNKAEAISVQADQGINYLQQMGQLIASFDHTFNSSNEQAQNSFQALTTTLDTAEQTLETELATAKENLENLLAKITNLDSYVDSTTTELKTQLDEVKNQADVMISDLNSEGEQTLTQMSNLAQKLQDSTDNLDHQGEEIKTNIEHFNSLVSTAQTDFNNGKNLLLEKFAQLQSAVTEKLDTVSSDFDNLMTESRDKQVNLESIFETTSHEVISNLSQQFTSEIPSTLTDSIDSLIEALSILSNISTTSEDLLGSGLGDIISDIDDVLAPIEGVLGVLDKVQDLLG